MEYTNPELPEGINTSKTHPLKEFAVLLLGVMAVAFVGIGLLIITADYFADKIPFSWEQKLPVTEFLDNNNNKKLPVYLEQTAEKVIAGFELPEDMSITVHYVNSDTVNAFATLGGHIVLYRGLLEKLSYEDELSMIIAHEIAHIKYRHPILSASHGIVIGLVLSLMGVSSADQVVDNLLGTAGMVAMIKYSRDYEYRADKDAVNSLIKQYGHAGGAMGLFKIFNAVPGKAELVEFLNTHPLTENRIKRAQMLIKAHSIVGENKMTPLPEKFKAWLKQQRVLAEKEKRNS